MTSSDSTKSSSIKASFHGGYQIGNVFVFAGRACLFKTIQRNLSNNSKIDSSGLTKIVKCHCRPQIYLTLSKTSNLKCYYHFFYDYIVHVFVPFHSKLEPRNSWISSLVISKKVQRNLKDLSQPFWLYTGRPGPKSLGKEKSDCPLDRYNTDCSMCLFPISPMLLSRDFPINISGSMFE